MGTGPYAIEPDRQLVPLTVLLTLFGFVSVVPHRYIAFPGISFEWIALIPSMLVVTILILGLGVRSSRTRVLSNPILLPTVTLSVVLALGAMASVSPLTGLLRTFYYSLTGITVSLCTHAVVRSTRDNQLVVRSMVWIGACVGGYGVFEFLDFVDVYGHIFDQDNARYRMLTTEDFGARIVASVGHPVYLGTFLAGLLPLSLYVGLSSRCRIALLSWSPFVLIATGLILTFTRGAYAAAAVSFYFYPRRLSRLRFGPTVLVVLVLAVGAVSLDQLRTGLTGQGTIDQFKRFRTDQRGLAYTHASALIQDSPLLGVGVGDYRYLANRYGDFNDTPDNVYLRILAEWGIVGGVMTAYLVILVLRGIRTAEECLVGSEVSSLGSAVLGALASLLVDMITCDALMFPLTRVQFWLIAGLGLSLGDMSTGSFQANHPKETGR